MKIKVIKYIKYGNYLGSVVVEVGEVSSNDCSCGMPFVEDFKIFFTLLCLDSKLSNIRCWWKWKQIYVNKFGYFLKKEKK